MKYNPYIKLFTRLFLGSVLVFLGLISFLGYRNVTPKSLRDKGEILSSKVTSTGDYAIQITNVSGPDAELKEKDYSTLFYTVTYKDESGKESKIGLHADDSDFYDLIDELKDTEDLEKNPKWLIAYANASSKFKKYSDIMGANLSYDELDYYITLENTASIRKRGITVFVLLSFLGAPFLLTGLFGYLSGQKNLKEFYKLYPELNESLDQVEVLGGYNEPDIRIFVYKNHLVSYQSNFKISDLQEAKRIYQHKFRLRFLFIPIIRKNQLLVILHSGKEVKLQMKLTSATKTGPALSRLNDYIGQHFPNIQLIGKKWE